MANLIRWLCRNEIVENIFLIYHLFSVVIVTWQGLTFVAIYAQPVQNSTNIDMIKIGDLLYSTNNGNVTNVRILDTTDPIKTESIICWKRHNKWNNTSYQSRNVYWDLSILLKAKLWSNP